MESVRTTLFIPRKYHRALKMLAHQKNTSMARLIQGALDLAYFRKDRKTASDLWGCCENTHLTDKDFEAAKNRLTPR